MGYEMAACQAFTGPTKIDLGDHSQSSGSETCSEVGGAGEDVTVMVVVHEAGTSGLKRSFNFNTSLHESSNDRSHVFTSIGALFAISLHRYDSEMIFFSNPDEEVGVIVVEDTTTVGPVSAHS